MSRRKSNVSSVIATIVVLLLIAGVIGALVYFTNGFTETPTSFYAVVNGKRVMSVDKGYEITDPLRIDVKYVFDKAVETKDYTIKILPHVSEDNDFSYVVDGRTVYWSEEKNLLAGFDIQKSEDYFLIAPKGDLQKILEEIHSGSEVSDCKGYTSADMFELRIVSYNEQNQISIYFSVPEGYIVYARDVTLDKSSVVF